MARPRTASCLTPHAAPNPPAPRCRAAAAPDEASLRRALFLTAGNGRELREFAPGLLGEGDLLGLSVGYKVLAAERHAAEGSGV